MKPDWKQFLINHGAEFNADTDELQHFGNPDRERRMPPQGAILCDLSHIGMISANGADAQSFLQGQLSSDLAEVTGERAQFSSYSSPKGRAITTFQITKRQDTYYLSLSADVLEAVLKRLRMFVMRSQVTLEDASDSLVHFGYADPRGEQRLGDIIGPVPQQALDVVEYGNLTLIRRPASVPRFEIMGELDEAKVLWNKLDVHATGVGRGAWDYFDIEAGLPHVTAGSMEAWVPQMMNLHLINAISFSKGCFPGQEVVARLKYLGKNKRQLYRIAIDSFALPTVGARINDEKDSEAGQILNASLNPDGKAEALAVMKIASVNGKLTLDGKAVRLLALPYAVDQEDDA